MKVIDLLNKIAKGEETPEKVKYGGIIYTKAVDYVTKEVIDYLNHNESLFEINDGFEYCFINKYLLDEVEIIEEDKKIEKIYVRERANDFLIGKSEHVCYGTESYVNKIISDKINEIIDYINKGVNK